MNEELKAAIAYFEDAIRESDEIIADCSQKLQEELDDQKRHFVVALNALRRAAERDGYKACYPDHGAAGRTQPP